MKKLIIIATALLLTGATVLKAQTELKSIGSVMLKYNHIKKSQKFEIFSEHMTNSDLIKCAIKSKRDISQFVGCMEHDILLKERKK